MQLFAVMPLFLGAVSAAAISSLKPFRVTNFHEPETPSQTQVSFNITDPNTDTTVTCYHSPLLLGGGPYSCYNDNHVKWDLNDDSSVFTVEWTWAPGELDPEQPDAYFKGNGSAPTNVSCHTENWGYNCTAPDFDVPITTIVGVA